MNAQRPREDGRSPAAETRLAPRVRPLGPRPPRPSGGMSERWTRGLPCPGRRSPPGSDNGRSVNQQRPENTSISGVIRRIYSLSPRTLRLEVGSNRPPRGGAPARPRLMLGRFGWPAPGGPPAIERPGGRLFGAADLAAVERQRRFRERRRAAIPVEPPRPARPARSKPRPARWTAAVAELRTLQE